VSLERDFELLKEEAKKVAQKPPFKDYLEALEEWRKLRKVLERLSSEEVVEHFEGLKRWAEKNAKEPEITLPFTGGLTAVLKDGKVEYYRKRWKEPQAERIDWEGAPLPRHEWAVSEGHYEYEEVNQEEAEKAFLNAYGSKERLIEALEEVREEALKTLETVKNAEEKENALFERFRALEKRVRALRREIPKPVFDAYYKIENLSPSELESWEVITIDGDDRRREVEEAELEELAQQVETPQAFYLLTALKGVGIPIEVEEDEEIYFDGEDAYLEHAQKAEEVYGELFERLRDGFDPSP